ncbi:MAG TPA: hypothetical protein VFA74_02655 [Terriglobales bacterium]|nr:hypothetical protein [Terriglobales bacterium]
MVAVDLIDQRNLMYNNVKFAFTCIVLLLSLITVGLGQNDSSPPKPPVSDSSKVDLNNNLALERERLEFERQKFAEEAAAEQQKLKLEQAKLDQEKSTASQTALLSLVPFLAAIGTLAYSIWSFRTQIKEQGRLQNETAALQFQMKAAEIAFAGSRTPEAVHNRAKALKTLFGDRLPADFATKFDPGVVGGNKEVAEAKQFFLELLLKHPERSGETADLWDALFNEEWMKRVKPILPLKQIMGWTDLNIDESR